MTDPLQKDQVNQPEASSSEEKTQKVSLQDQTFSREKDLTNFPQEASLE